MDLTPITITPVGFVRNPVQDIYHHGYEDVLSEIVINPGLEQGLEGIDGFSHLEGVFYFHCLEYHRIAVKRRPQDREDVPETGVFAHSTQLLPSAIGTTVVHLLERAGNVLRIQDLDAVDGTPVLDNKPFTPRDNLSPEEMRVSEL